MTRREQIRPSNYKVNWISLVNRRSVNHTNFNLFHYAGNNPVKYVDPTGMWSDNHDGTYTAEKGDTLWGLYGKDWKEKSGYTGDPTKLQVGDVVGAYKTKHKVMESKIEESNIGVDMNFFDPSSNIYDYAKLVENPDNVFVVGGHGDSETFHSNYSGQGSIGPDTLAKLIKNHPNYHTGMSVLLLSCRTGKISKNGYDSTYAVRLADAMGEGIDVWAPDEYVNYYNNGDIDVSRFEPIFIFGKKINLPFGQGDFQCFTGR